MYAELTLLVLGVGMILLYIDRHDKFKMYGNMIPGPIEIPISGNYLNSIFIGRGSFESFMKYFQKYGKTFRLWIGSYLCIFVCNKDDIQMLLTNQDLTVKANTYTARYGNALLPPSGELWHIRRRAITPTFDILDDFVPVFNKYSKILVSVLDRMKEQVIDIEPYLTAATLDAISESAMGTSVKALTNTESVTATSTYQLTRAIRERVNINWYRFILTLIRGRNKKEDKCYWHLYKFAEMALKEIKKKELIEKGSQENNSQNEDEEGVQRMKPFLERLLEIKNTDAVAFKNDAEVLDAVVKLMLDGYEKTSSCLSFTVWLLGKHTDVQDKVFEEVSAIISENPELKTEHLNAMKYLENVIKESLRLYPPVPIFGRTMERDTRFPSGYTMPKKARVHVPVHLVHRDPDNFVEPLKFNPDRFEQREEGSSSYTYVPFSAGSRLCPGQRLVMLELKAILSMIVYNFKIQTEREVKPTPDIILWTIDGVHVSLTKRNEE